MPLYEVLHSYPLTEAQHADFAQRITAIHTKLFTVPAVFVNVRFQYCAKTEHYMGGKKLTGNTNLVIANVRAGPSRSHHQWESLCRQIETAWTICVGEAVVQSEPSAQFTAAIVHGVLTAAYEQGFMAPQAGQDGEWMRANLPRFQALADSGQVFFQDMIAEMRGREEFKSVFE